MSPEPLMLQVTGAEVVAFTQEQFLLLVKVELGAIWDIENPPIMYFS